MISMLLRGSCLLIIVFFFSCKGNNKSNNNDNGNDIVAQWKPVRLFYSGSERWGAPRELDLTDLESFRTSMFRAMLEDPDPGFPNDSISVRQKVDSMINYYQNARLTLQDSSRFMMIGQAIITRGLGHGWDMSDTLHGTWQRDSSQLRLTIIDNPVLLKYEILKLTKDTLVLRDSTYSNDLRPNKTVTFIKR